MVPPRKPTLKRKFQQLRESGASSPDQYTDSGVPTQFYTQTTWNELDVWVRAMGVDPMDTRGTWSARRRFTARGRHESGGAT